MSWRRSRSRLWRGHPSGTRPDWLTWAWLLAAAMALSAPAGAEPPMARWLAVPFAQRLDMAVVTEVVRSPPAQLIGAMTRAGVDVRLVPSTTPGKPVNPLLAGLPVASATLLEQADFRDSYEGKVVLAGSRCCGLARDTVLVRDTASTYTLLHEFVQSRLVPTDGHAADDELELRFTIDFRRLVTYQRRLHDDATRLLDPRWRRDVLAAQAAVAERLFARIQMGQSQEAIVERVLCCEVDEQSPYHDPARQAEGLRYGELMIDNAIDLFNTLLESVNFVQDVVQALHGDVHAAGPAPDGAVPLSRQDVDAVEAAARRIHERLAPVRAEILALKQFYRP